MSVAISCAAENLKKLSAIRWMMRVGASILASRWPTSVDSYASSSRFATLPAFVFSRYCCASLRPSSGELSRRVLSARIRVAMSQFVLTRPTIPLGSHGSRDLAHVRTHSPAPAVEPGLDDELHIRSPK